MTKHCLLTTARPPLLDLHQLEQIEEAMLRILEKIGLTVLEEEVRDRLCSGGFIFRDHRVLFERKIVLEFLEEERSRHGNTFSEGPESLEPADATLHLSVNPYAQRVHDPETDQIVPFTTERLIEATRLVEALDLGGSVGCPQDVPPPLQPVVQYWIAAVFCSRGRYPVDPKSLATLPYIMDMAEVLGNPLRSLPVYVFSPLTLGGESLKCVLEFRDQLSAVNVSDMASLGCTTPIHLSDALALCVAEVIGTVLVLREILDLPIRWSIRLCPVDLHSLAMVLGSPEDLLLQMANAEVNAYFHGSRWHPGVGGLHTNAPLPGPQACVEKTNIMTAGALWGARHFGIAGGLSLDEIFSAEQLLYDLEIRDHVQRLIAGFEVNGDPEECLREIREGLRQGSFVGLDSTLRSYPSVYWRPRLFERQLAAAWEGAGAPTIRQKAQAQVRELLRQPTDELSGELRRELDRILDRARAELI